MADTFLSRPYHAPGDMDRILGLVKSRAAGHILDFPSLADIEEILALPAIQATTRIWETERGEMAGYALFHHGHGYASLHFEINPLLAGHEAEEEMLAWGEQVYCREYQGQAEELSTGATAGQRDRITLLEQHGYRRDPESVVYFARALEESIPEPKLPQGFTIRPLAGRAEMADWVELHRAAFGTQNMTIEYRQAMMGAPAYIAELDLVAVAPDGKLAAYVVGSIHLEENALTGQETGWTDPVATHPAYQRIGLSRALLLESLLRLKARGMQFARLGTSSANTAMQRAAQSAGYRQAGEAYHYVKKLRVSL